MRKHPIGLWIVLWLVTLCLGAAVAMRNAAGGQEGVAGSTPVFSGPKKNPLPGGKETPQGAPNKGKEKQTPDILVLTNLVTTPVTAIDPSGDFVYDLDEKDFEILDNGTPQRIESFETEPRTLAAVIVIQANDVVAPLLSQVQPLAPLFSSLVLGARGEAAVLSFGDQVRVLQDFSSDGERLSKTLGKLSERGDQSRLNDALMRAIALLAQRPREERRVIIAFSDGADRGSETQKEEVVRRATGAEVAIYGLGFSPIHELLSQQPKAPPPSPLDTNVTRPLPPGTVPTPTNSENVWSTPVAGVTILTALGELIQSKLASSLLEFYAGYTGGAYYGHWSKKALQDQLTRIASELYAQYELAYTPDTLSQTGFHRIEVRVRRPGVRVRARAGYFYAGKPAPESGKTPAGP